MNTIFKNSKYLAIMLIMFGMINFQSMAQEIKEEQKIMPAQLTLISPLGTNGLESGRVINRFSVNIWAGVSGGVLGAEFGGLANFSKGNVTGFQGAGLINASLGALKGAQFAGLANYNQGNITGSQASGIANISLGTVMGPQFAGIANVNIKDATGGMFSGIINTTVGNMNGVQFAGIANVTIGKLNGMQFGLVNYAHTLSGFQLGLINVAHTVEKGSALGLITYFKNGYHRFEMEYNETFYLNATFKSGVPHLYMIYTIGFKTDSNTAYWAPGIGVGTLVGLSDKLDLNSDLIVRQVNEDEWWTDDLNLLNTLKVNLAYNITDRFAIYGGPSLNVAVSGIKDEEGMVIGETFVPWHFFDKTYDNHAVKMYVGFNAGIRF